MPNILKRLCQILCLWVVLVPCYAQFGQTLEINTHFRSIIGKPTWLLIIRDQDNGSVLPYLFDIRNNDNFWIAFTMGHTYRITVSQLKFGPFAIINNFCHLQSCDIEGKSMRIILRGKLSPYRGSSVCDVMQYKDMPFPIVNRG